MTESAPAFGSAPVPAQSDSELSAESAKELNTIREFLKTKVDPALTDAEIVGAPMQEVYETSNRLNLSREELIATVFQVVKRMSVKTNL